MATMPKLFSKEDDYDVQIKQASKDSGTPFGVLKGFVGLESAYDEKSYRYEAHIKDASYGLAQVLNTTARGVGFKGAPAELFDPYKSVLYGGKFLAALAKKYPNLLDLIAAYNMGYPRKITATTQFIADLYKYPIQYRTEPPADWTYANEPYVRRVSSYIAFYQAKEAGDVALAQKIYDLIKKKVLMRPTDWLNLSNSVTPPPSSPTPVKVGSLPPPPPSLPSPTPAREKAEQVARLQQQDLTDSRPLWRVLLDSLLSRLF